MTSGTLWKYCTPARSREYLLSLRLLGDTPMNHAAQLSCLYAVANHTEKHYNKFFIPKKGGGRRELLAPDYLLKTIQKNLLHRVLDTLSLSPKATAYHTRGGVLQNAAPHAGSRLLLKLDIENFFPSILFPRIYQMAFPAIFFPPELRGFFSSLCCYQDHLPQGAPTSPAVSNLVMKPFDTYMGKWCEERGVAYTRYCDDMAFSGDFDPVAVKQKAGAYLREIGFSLNYGKTRLLTQAARQIVTGVVVNDKPQASRAYRQTLRQELYYCCKYGPMEHLSRLHGKPCAKEDALCYLQSLLGKVQFVLQINPGDTCFQREKQRLKKLLSTY